jgi:hypothetical protein
MAERSNPTPAPAEEAAAEVDASLSAHRPRRQPGRRRWPATRPRRPPWWAVPPQGYLEVESHHSPTSPRALRTLARAAVKAGLRWDPGNPLPVQRFVAAQERARLVFQARRELPRVTAVASQVILVDSRLAKAEETLRQAVDQRSAARDPPARRHRRGIPRYTTWLRAAAGRSEHASVSRCLAADHRVVARGIAATVRGRGGVCLGRW